MSEIKTITSLATETEITFNDFWQFVWVKNTGDGDCYVSNKSGIEAGAVDVIAVKASETALVITETQSIYSKGATTLECHGQNFAECPFKRTAKGGESISVEPLSVFINGTYTAPTGSAYSPVTVDVQEQPWQPLEDGYSNFWFELTDDTLSPWLNFSAKNNDAVIDWGDGSGEVALDTLTPTHTYAKAGKYVVKVRGVTGIARQIAADATNYEYFRTLKAVELSTEIIGLQTNCFWQCTGLEACKVWNNNMYGESGIFYGCGSLHIVNLPANLTILRGNAFYQCLSLNEITLPSELTSIGVNAFRETYLKSIVLPATVESIGAYAFMSNQTLSTIHMLPTTPPTLGSTAFSGLPSDYIIYVPVGTAETYKAAAGWSAYADHILEEGQSVTRAMQRKFAKEAKALLEENGEDVSR